MSKSSKNPNAAETWEYQLYASASASKRRAWILSFFLMGITTISLLTLLMVLPLKTFEPYIITVDRSTGFLEVTRGLADTDLSSDEAITQANLVGYVNARETYNPATLEKNYYSVLGKSDAKALKEYSELWDGQNANNPSRMYGKKTTIDVKIKSVNFITDNIASVRFIREKRTAQQVTVSHHEAVIEFQYTQKPMKMADRFLNPLGFQVTSYRLSQEVLEK